MIKRFKDKEPFGRVAIGPTGPKMYLDDAAAERLNEVVRMLNRFERMSVAGRVQKDADGNLYIEPEMPRFVAKITSAGPPYSWLEQTPGAVGGAYVDLEGGRQGTNAREYNGGSVGIGNLVEMELWPGGQERFVDDRQGEALITHDCITPPPFEDLCWDLRNLGFFQDSIPQSGVMIHGVGPHPEIGALGFDYVYWDSGCVARLARLNPTIYDNHRFVLTHRLNSAQAHRFYWLKYDDDSDCGSGMQKEFNSCPSGLIYSSGLFNQWTMINQPGPFDVLLGTNTVVTMDDYTIRIQECEEEL